MGIRSNIVKIILGISTFAFVGCGTQKPELPQEFPLAQVRCPLLTDQPPYADLYKAIHAQLSIVSTTGSALTVGAVEVARPEYAEALRGLELDLDQSPPIRAEQLQATLEKRFECYAYGRGEIKLTGYFFPRIEGRSHRQKSFTQALYQPPKDLLRFDPSAFGLTAEKRAWRARVIGNLVVPYAARNEIDRPGKVWKSAKIIAWVRPIDAFMLQIQGSGEIVLPGGRSLVLAYADRNGWPYSPIGREVMGRLNKPTITWPEIRHYAETLSEEELRNLLAANPSYVFFQESKTRARTASNLPAIAGRTIATDARWFPRGLLSILQRSKETRLVAAQDAGGAIKGQRRIDLFFGDGAEAEEMSGSTNESARLVVLLPRSR